MKIKQSVCFPLFRVPGGDIDSLFREIARIGYAAIEFWQRSGLENYESVIESAHSAGLVVASMSGHESLTDGLNKPENHDRIEAELRESIDIAARHSIAGLICFSGNRNARQSDLAGMMTCARGLRRIAGYAEERGINLNVELLNSRINHPGYQCDHTEWGAALCEMVDSPRVKLLYDIYHMQIMEGDIIRTVQTYIDRIGHFHTAGNPGRRDMDDTQEMNYTGICKAIAATRYEYYVGHEYNPKGDPLSSLAGVFAQCDQQ